MLTFTIVSCNVLYQAYYVQYVDSHPIDIKKRCTAFHQALKSDHALRNADILCFQEWPYNPGTLRKQFEQEKVIVDTQEQNKLDYFSSQASIQSQRFLKYVTHYYPHTDYYYVMDSIAEKDGVLTIINKHKFKIISYKFTIFTPNKKMLTTIISPHNVHYPIGLINAHLPFKRIEQYPKEFPLMHQEIKNYPKDQPWIVCGDFNYTILQGTAINKEKYKRLKKFFPGMHSNADTLVQPTSTSSHTRFNLNDFILYSNSIECLHANIFPDNKQDLLRHIQENKKIRYFSDHAIVRMNLKL